MPADTQTSRDRPEAETGVKHRGVALPEGMTPQCLDALASLFNDFSDDLIEDTEDAASHVLAAVKAYRIVIAADQLSQTAVPPLR